MSGLGILGAIAMGGIALLAGVPLVIAGAGVVLAIGAAGLAVGFAGAVLAAIGGLLWFVVRLSFGAIGLLAWLVAGGISIAIAGVIASHLLPLVLIGGIVWLVLRASRPSARPALPQAI
jgi:hypothetical protein